MKHTKRHYWENLAPLPHQMEKILCPLCDCPDSICVSTVDRNHIPLRTVVCQHCSLTYINPRPNQSWYAHFYDKHYRKLYEGISTVGIEYTESKEKLRKHQHNIKMLLPFLSDTGAILDIGAAEGFFLNLFRESKPHYELFGIEPNPHFVEFANTTYKLDNVVTGHFPEALKNSNKKFNAIHSSHVFEHILDPNQFLEHCRYYLADEGFLFIDVPNVLTKRKGCRYVHIAHVFHYSQQTLSWLLEKWGFKVIAYHDQLRESENSSEIPWTVQIIAQKQAKVPHSYSVPAANNVAAFAKQLRSRWKMKLFRRLKYAHIELRYRLKRNADEQR